MSGNSGAPRERSLPDWAYRQSAAVPYLWNDGELHVVLITSAKSRKWGIPKGIVEPNLTPAESAEMEALEEAGVRGAIDPTSIAEYAYDKWGGTCTVQVFPLHVTKVLRRWEESHVRERCIVPAVTAVTFIKPVLVDVLRQFERYIVERSA